MPTAPQAAPAAKPRSSSKRVLVWSAAAVVALALGCFAILFAIPFLQARSAVRKLATGRIGPERAVENLGGPEAAAGRLGLYFPKAWKPENRAQAATILGCCGRHGTAILATALSDADDRVRRNAAEALARIGPEALDAVSALARALEDPAPDICRAAAEALGQIGPGAGPAVGALATMAGSGRQELRIAAAEALGKIGREALPAAPALSRTLRGSTGDLRIAAAVALCRIGVEGREVLAPLVEALSNGDWQTRMEAAETLGRIGPSARTAAPHLEKTARDDNISEVRAAAAEALRKIRGR